MSNTTIQDARTAISATITAAGLTCYAYENTDIPTKLGGELGLDDYDAALAPDQRIIFTRLAFTLRVYQPMTGNTNAALAYLDASIATVLTALGADRTLANKVRNIDILGGSVEFTRYANGAQCAIGSFSITVTPHPGQ